MQTTYDYKIHRLRKKSSWVDNRKYKMKFDIVNSCHKKGPPTSNIHNHIILMYINILFIHPLLLLLCYKIIVLFLPLRNFIESKLFDIKLL